MKILIVGAGIAGPTLAWWLLRAGHEPTLVERAMEPRRGGYVIDFWGAGLDVAERMDLLPDIMAAGYQVQEMRQVDHRGRTVTALDTDTLARAAGGRFTTIARSELAGIVYQALEDRVETRFGDTVAALDDQGTTVEVTFERGDRASYDLVIGADGLHSRVRQLVFGPQDAFERALGVTVAAFEVEGYRPRDELVYVMHTEVGRQIARFAVRGDKTLFLMTFLDDGRASTETVDVQQDVLRERLAGARWETPAILDLMPEATSFYFDRVSQIRMDAWTRGRVALIGDAASCPSLLAGQGSALAMVQGYVLAAELARTGGDHVEAFARYERTLMPLLRSKQDGSSRLKAIFAPKSRLQLTLRNGVMRLMGLPLVARLAVGRSLTDAIELPPPPTP